MKTMKIVLTNILTVLCLLGIAQNDTLNEGYFPKIHNVKAISNFYNKLAELEANELHKVRITHIGDSHIQADYFTGDIREKFQNEFGYGGYGFSFPYKLAKTNGTKKVKYTTNAEFFATRNIFADDILPVGISGYSFISTTKNTAIKLSLSDECNYFNTIKVFYPENRSDLAFADYNSTKDFNKTIPKYSEKIHIIKSGEYLSTIASKYNVSVLEIKKANKLKSDIIYIGKDLKIPLKTLEKVNIEISDFNILESSKFNGVCTYHSSNLRNEIYLFSNNTSKDLAINGFVLENDKKGIVYNAIGVNGAKSKDYNRFPLFFKQLSHLESDLIVISTGTNESFDNLSPELFLKDFLLMIENIRKQNPNIEIIITTPPPSLFKRKNKNTFIPQYIHDIVANMYEYNYAVWDLYEAMGAHEKIHENYINGYLAKDKVHYKKTGYSKQAELFYFDLMHFYKNR